jgi:hypothetical protein
MVVMAIPIFTSTETGKSAGDSVADRTEYYTTAKNLLTSGADAMERLMTAYKVSLKMFLQSTKLPLHPHKYMLDCDSKICVGKRSWATKNRLSITALSKALAKQKPLTPWVGCPLVDTIHEHAFTSTHLHIHPPTKSNFCINFYGFGTQFINTSNVG